MTLQELNKEINKAEATPRWLGIRGINQVLAICFEDQDAKAKITINTPNLGVKMYDIIINGEVVWEDLSLTDDTEYYIDKAEFLMIISEIMLNLDEDQQGPAVDPTQVSEDLMWLKSNDADLIKIAQRYNYNLTTQQRKAIERYDHIWDNEDDYEDVPDHIQDQYHAIRFDLIDLLLGL